MTGPSPANRLWQAHLERLQRLTGATTPPPRPARTRGAKAISAPEAEAARRAEWTAVPLGRLGRRLLADVDPYLEFFAIARAG
jgi:hypothetical protein